MQAFWLALGFLTRLPAPALDEVTPELQGRSVLWYPAVGALLGLIFLLLAQSLAGVSSMVAAAAVLAAWVGLTGALHLDGLADSADGWVGGQGDGERTLAIMKDPYSGPVGMSATVTLLILKFALLAALIDNQSWIAILLAPVVGRSLILLLFLTTPYVRQGGLGQSMADLLPRDLAQVLLLLIGVMLIVVEGMGGLLTVVAAVALLMVLRRYMIARIGGTTGDTAGALVEIGEVVVLLGLAIF